MTNLRQKVDLNADMGEFANSSQRRLEHRLLDFVSSANIACGFHAGNPDTIAEMVAMTRLKGVALGAHPSILSSDGFGRSWSPHTKGQIRALMLYQIGALKAISGGRLQHVKPHGALYNRAAKDREVATAVTTAISEAAPGALQFVLANSVWQTVALELGAVVVKEAFADRAYLPNGLLAPRSKPGAVISDPETVARRAVSMVVDGIVEDLDGNPITITADTICIHSDTPNALDIAKTVRGAFNDSKVDVTALSPFALKSG